VTEPETRSDGLTEKEQAYRLALVDEHCSGFRVDPPGGRLDDFRAAQCSVLPA